MTAQRRRKGNVILMKQTRSGEAVKRSSAPSVRKVGTMLGISAFAVMAISGAGIFALTNGADDLSKETQAATERKTSSVTVAEDVTTTAQSESAVSTTVSWWKAGVEEYGIVEGRTASETTTTSAETTTTTTTSKTTTETTTTKATTTTAKKTTTAPVTTEPKAASAITEGIKKADKDIYAIDNVNLRSEASTDSKVITIIKLGTKVKCTGATADGWLKITYNGNSGYCRAEYLSEKAPATTTTAKKTKATTTTTTAAATKTETKTQTTAKETVADTSVISYTDEEFTMMCYVLQSEVGGCSDNSKIAVANVIINRVKSNRFANTLKGVLTSPNQFTAIYNYYNNVNPPTQRRGCGSVKRCGILLRTEILRWFYRGMV